MENSFSTSVWSLLSSINAAFGAGSQSPDSFSLPNQLRRDLVAFTNTNSEIDISTSRSLHDGLLAVYRQFVLSRNRLQKSPEAAELELTATTDQNILENQSESENDCLQVDLRPFSDIHNAFISVLSILCPVFKSPDIIFFWWNQVIVPAIDCSGLRPLSVLKDTRSFVYSILLPRDDPSVERSQIAAAFLRNLIDAYTIRSKLWSPSVPPHMAEDQHLIHELELVLSYYGASKPKELLVLIDEMLPKAHSRMQGLRLLCTFIESQALNLDIILQTSILDHLLTSLLTDMSGVVVSMALTALVALMPHIPETLSTLLPTLFLIYNRIVCWDLYIADAEEDQPMNEHSSKTDQPHVSRDDNDHTEPAWESISLGFDGTQVITPKADIYFTLLYGLFPIAFTSFIRKPRRYLKDSNFPAAREVELKQSPMATRSLKFQASHILHPNFINFSLEEEQESFRFRRDPSELMVECLSFCITYRNHLKSEEHSPGYVDQHKPDSRSKLDNEGHGLDDDVNDLMARLNFDPGFNESSKMESKEAIPENVSNTAKSHSLAIAEEDYPTTPSLVLEDTDSNLESSSSHSSASTELPPKTADSISDLPNATHLGIASLKNTLLPTIDCLQRTILILDTELKFERYLRQEHLASLSAAQQAVRSQQANHEEAQTLIQSNKFLRQRLAHQTEDYNRLQHDVVHRVDSRKLWAEQVEKQARQTLERERQILAKFKALQAEMETAKLEAERHRKSFEELSSGHLLSVEMVTELDSRLQETIPLKEKLKEAEIKLRAQDGLAEKLKSTLEECEHWKAAAEVWREHRPEADFAANGDGHRMDEGVKPQSPSTGDSTGCDPPNPMLEPKPDSGVNSSNLGHLLDTVLAAKNGELESLRAKYELVRVKTVEAERRCLELEGLYMETKEEVEGQKKRVVDLEKAVGGCYNGGPDSAAGADPNASQISLFSTGEWRPGIVTGGGSERELVSPSESANLGPISPLSDTGASNPSGSVNFSPVDREFSPGSQHHNQPPHSGKPKPVGHQPSFMERILGVGLHHHHHNHHAHHPEHHHGSPHDPSPSNGSAHGSHDFSYGYGHLSSARGRLVSKSSGLSSSSAGTSAAPVTATGTIMPGSSSSGAYGSAAHATNTALSGASGLGSGSGSGTFSSIFSSNVAATVSSSKSAEPLVGGPRPALSSNSEASPSNPVHHPHHDHSASLPSNLQQDPHSRASTTRLTPKSDSRLFGRGGAQHRDRMNGSEDVETVTPSGTPVSSPLSGPDQQHDRPVHSHSKSKLVAAHLLELGGLRK